MTIQLPAEIFKAYDIRGIVGKTLTPEICHAVGQALGSLARERQQTAIAVGRDGRLSGPELAGALMQGIVSAGVDAIDLGCVPTPLTYFAAYELGCHSCVSVTGSHNPPDYNGLKMVIGGETLALDAIQQLKARIEAGNLLTGNGQIRQADARCLRRQDRRRCKAGAPDEDRHGLRQRRRRRHRPGPVQGTRLLTGRAVL